MQNRIFPAQIPWFQPELEQFPIVLIAYESAAAARKALQALHRIFANAGEPTTFRPILWSFDRLYQSECRAHATDDASKADILVIASSVENPFSPAVIEWFADCVSSKRGQTAAIVTLFDSPAEQGSTSVKVDFLRRAAADAGLDFFAEDAPATEAEPIAPSKDSAPIHFCSMPDRFWGLNE